MLIVLSANNQQEVFVIPYCPPDVQIEAGQTVDDYDGLSFHLMMPGNLEPCKVSWSAIYPCRNYPFCEPSSETDPEAFVAFIRRWREKYYPIRIVITDDSKTILNMAALVESFSYSYTKVGNLNYSLSLVEYRFIQVT